MCICINNFTVHCRTSSETEQIENSWLQLYVHQSASSCLDSSKRIEKSLPACTFNSKLIIANSPNHSRRKWLFNRLYSEQTIYLPNSPYLVYDTCTCISLVRDWKRKLKLITPGSERVFQISWNFAFFLVLWQSHIILVNLILHVHVQTLESVSVLHTSAGIGYHDLVDYIHVFDQNYKLENSQQWTAEQPSKITSHQLNLKPQHWYISNYPFQK